LSPKEKKEKKGQESHIQESGSEAEQAAESDSDIEVLGKDFLRKSEVGICVFFYLQYFAVLWILNADPAPAFYLDANRIQVAKLMRIGDRLQSRKNIIFP
jgi:hypothetical protein